MEKETKRTILISIFTGIIVFILCYLFIQPILNFITPRFLIFCAKFASLCSNSIYKNASLMDTNRFDIFLFIFVTGLMASTFLLPILFFFKKRAKIDTVQKWPAWFFKIKIIIISILGLIFFLVVTLWTYSDYYLNSGFERRMVILAPYLSEQQEEELLSKWAIMANRDDYVKINDLLYNLAVQNNITEPKSLWAKKG